MPRTLCLALTVAIGLASWSMPALSAEKLSVVASFSIIGDFARNVGGDRIELTTLVGPDGDAHVYEPKPADAVAMARIERGKQRRIVDIDQHEHALERRELMQLIGPAAGRHLHALANNRDPRRVETGRRRRSIGSRSRRAPWPVPPRRAARLRAS